MATNWLQNLKTGDKVVVESRYSRKILTVDRTTETQILVGSDRFKKSNGREIGSSDVWDITYLKELTPEVKEEITTENLRGKCRELAEKLPRKLNSLNKDDLIKIKDFLENYLAK